MEQKLTHGSLFSGIGGFDLAAEWMGWENVFHCEWNEFGQKILKHYWPDAASYNDITKTDFSIHRGKIDILTGGFPCQPYSMAGKRLGKEDDRHLWPEMLRAIREIQPKWVVGENVFGLINWNGGLVFNEVQADLEAQGYEVQPYVLPACAVNAPHRRDRVWFVAHANRGADRRTPRQDAGKGREERVSERNEVRQPAFTGEVFGVTANAGNDGFDGAQNGQGHREGNDGNAAGQDATKQPSGCSSKAAEFNTNSDCNQRCKGGLHKAKPQKAERYLSPCNARSHRRGNWQDFPTQPPVCNGDDGLPTELDGITLSKWRNESIKAGGNAIVPQVAFQIFKAITHYHAKP